MTDTNPSRLDLRGASLVLAGAMCVIPFLQPRHFPPIRTFYDEWLSFALGLAAIGVTAAVRRKAARIPTLALWLGAFAFFLLVRSFDGQSAYPQGPLLWSLYALFAALLVFLGNDLVEHFGRDRVCDVLAVFLLSGAILNSVAGVLQVFGIPRIIDSLVSYLHGNRAIGNVGQANLFANYLALGEASLIYLFARGRLGLIATVAGGLLLVAAAAMAASRSSTLYALLFALLGGIACRGSPEPIHRKLVATAVLLAISGILAQWLVPVGLHGLGFSVEGGFDRNASSESISDRDESTKLRLLVWGQAWRLIESAPWLGVGPGQFAGAAFSIGLPRELTGNEIWTSPHNLVLQLLAETGLAGAALVGVGVATWFFQAGGKFLRDKSPALWWILACTSVEFIHALFEYPFWYANFLAVTALVMGVGAGGGIAAHPALLRTILASGAITGGVLAGVAIRDYFEFELASPVSAGRSLASDAEVERDRESLARLGHGLLAPRAELWLFLSLPLDSTELARKVSVGERVVRVWPSRDVVVRQSIFLAMAGRQREAVALLEHGVRTFENRRKEIAESIAAAPREAREILKPVLQDRIR